MVYIGVGIGGMVGSVLRYFVSLTAASLLSNGFPIGTLLVNLAGSLFLGWFTAAVISRNKMNPILSASIGTGLTGSFTTFSTFSMETLIMIESGRIGMGIVYVLLSAVGGLLLAAAGFKIGSEKQGQRGHCG
ncbi:fluoride efflux transporter CrcB [Mesobacillus jeotgali]|uniref:fluoride efflux transporter CrcB n=1 Tax=Mesobacillus jeotgali TaxID=129985 RepID=UPI0009A8C9E1|nr:fluoride efflux transporter CrcB [Mesobacillus jeotgali]